MSVLNQTLAFFRMVRNSHRKCRFYQNKGLKVRIFQEKVKYLNEELLKGIEKEFIIRKNVIFWFMNDK
jgi:hypothetical protein